MKRTITAASIAVALLCAFALASCAKASAEQPQASEQAEPLEVSDVAVESSATAAAVDTPAQDVDEIADEPADTQEQPDEQAEFSQYSDSEPVWDFVCYEEQYEPVYYEYGDYSALETTYAPTDGLTREGGVNYHDGRTETYYSSNVAYHQNTQEWTLDDEGFYRTDEGYYVVAASDMEQGTVFEGSKGDCIVLDCGCPDGITDYYVGW